MNRERDIDIAFITSEFSGRRKIDGYDCWFESIFDYTLAQKMIFLNPANIFFLDNIVYCKSDVLMKYIVFHRQDIFEECKQAIAYDIKEKYLPFFAQVNAENIDSKIRYRQWLYEMVFSLFIIKHNDLQLDPKEKETLSAIRGKNGLLTYDEIDEIIGDNISVIGAQAHVPPMPCCYFLLDRLGESMDNRQFVNRYKILLQLSRGDFDPNSVMFFNAETNPKYNFDFINRCIALLVKRYDTTTEEFWSKLNRIYQFVFEDNSFETIGQMRTNKDFSNLKSLVEHILTIENNTLRKALCIIVLRYCADANQIFGNEDILNQLIRQIENDDEIPEQFEL